MREEWVRRITWKLAHSMPASCNFGRNFRRQQLSFAKGVFPVSEGKTQASVDESASWRAKDSVEAGGRRIGRPASRTDWSSGCQSSLCTASA